MIVDPLSICTNGFIVSSDIAPIFAIASGGISYTISISVNPRPTDPTPTTRIYQQRGGSSVYNPGSTIRVTVYKDDKKYTKSIKTTKKNINLSNIKIEEVDNVIKINIKRI